MTAFRSRLFSTCLLFIVAVHSEAQAADNQAELNLQTLAAARSGNIKQLQKLVDDGASPNTRNRLGDSLLMTAIKNGKTEIAQRVIDLGADVNLANTAKVTPLMAAAYYGQPDMAQLLIEKKSRYQCS